MRQSWCCRLFRQPLVPLVGAANGKWLVPQGLAPILKPGGHGAIWKLMLDEGVFSWMYQHDREAAIVRQIRYTCTTRQEIKLLHLHYVAIHADKKGRSKHSSHLADEYLPTAAAAAGLY